MKPRNKRTKNLGPKRRLASAKAWLPTYKGNDVARKYAKRYGVPLSCVLRDLASLKVKLDPSYLLKIQAAIEAKLLYQRPPKRKKTSLPEGYASEWDDEFSFIAGFTEGGAPYGTTWAETEETASDEEGDGIPF